MHISDQHVDALRAFFAGPEEHQRHVLRLDAASDLTGYSAMVAATLFELVNRRLSWEDRGAEIIRWVANARARRLREEQAGPSPSPPAPNPTAVPDLSLDPAAAEGVLRTISGLDPRDVEMDEVLHAETQFQLLTLLRLDLDLDDEAFERVMCDARELAARVQPTTER